MSVLGNHPNHLDQSVLSDMKVHICQYCQTTFTCKQHRWRHQKTCYQKPKMEIDSYPVIFMSGLSGQFGQSGSQFHDKLKLSLKERQSLLMQIIKENNPLLIFKIIYLHDSYEKWPVARNNDRYRYLNGKHELIEDNGELLIKYIYTHSHRSLIQINVQIIKEQLKSFSYMDYLYNTYDLKVVQDYLHRSCYRTNIFKQIKQNFNKLIDRNTDDLHPFFKNIYIVKIY